MDRSEFSRLTAKLGIDLDGTQLAAFDQFEQDLYEFNLVKNVTRVPREECADRHFLDSLLIAEFLAKNSALLDLGTGPGFPAWPLACARPDLQVTAMDSNGKMIGFLKDHPLPNLVIVQGRAEDLRERSGYDVVTGRALAPLLIQLELSAGPCRVGGRVLPMRTPNDLPAPPPPLGLGLELVAVHERQWPGGDVVRVFPEYRKSGRTADRFPRTWAEMKRSPPG